MNNQFISVIIPIYNTKTELSRCIESVLNQTYKEIEILLIDDGSTDGSSEICDSYADKYENIRVIHKENGGLISARITGVDNASSEVIAFVDSDDYIESNMYEEFYNIYKSFSPDIISSGILREVIKTGKKYEVCDNYEEGMYTDLNKAIYPSMLYSFQQSNFGLFSTLVNKLFKRHIMRKTLKEIDTRIYYGEDAAILYRYMLFCSSAYILKKSFYHYCIRYNSMCDIADIKLLHNSYYLYKSLEEAFANHECHHSLMRQLRRYMIDIEKHTLYKLYDINASIFNEWVFNYPVYVFEHKYALYGAGACGQALYHHLSSQDKLDNLVAWIDKNPVHAQKYCDYNIQNIEEGLKNHFDYIIIAIKDDKIAQSVSRELEEQYLISTSKIIYEPIVEKDYFSKAMY